MVAVEPKGISLYYVMKTLSSRVVISNPLNAAWLARTISY